MVLSGQWGRTSVYYDRVQNSQIRPDGLLISLTGDILALLIQSPSLARIAQQLDSWIGRSPSKE
jgi:hypothetical protein